jgi:hypothetical protein
MASSAFGQATRTWVSGVGDDANPCSRTAPCKTFAGAISKTAAGGEINALDPGGYGAVTITKSITIDGGAGQIAGVLVSGTNGIVINAGPNDVVRLRNLDINGLGNGLNGIIFFNGGSLMVENVQIYGFAGTGIDFTPSGPSSLSVLNASIENNAGGAVYIGGSGTPNGRLENVSMIGGQRGLRVEDGATVHVKNSTAAYATGNGFIAAATSRAVDLTLEGCGAFHNGNGGIFAGSLATVKISNCSVSGNATGLLVAGGAIVSSGNNTVQGNGTNGAPTNSPGTI